MKSLGWYLTAILGPCYGLFGIIHIQEPTNPPLRCPRQYTIYDLGASEIDASLMNRFAMPHSFAPQINNSCQVSANRNDEGFVRDPGRGEFVPQIGYSLRGRTYGINNNGDTLATLERNRENIDWFIWGLKDLRTGKRYPVNPTDGITGLNIDLRAINDEKWAVGHMNPGCVLRPVVWNPRWGLKPLGFYLGWDFKGTAFGINKKGTIVGTTTECSESPPFVWNDHSGLEILRHYKIPFEAQSCIKITGSVYFADVVITDDHYVYGTFWIDQVYFHDDGKIPFHAFRWEPYNHDFRALDLNGMRINAVNSKHTLVGTIDGQAALRERGEKPLLLKDYTKDPDWQLIEATDINDNGDIVGYGRYKGSMHIFMLKREYKLNN